MEAGVHRPFIFKFTQLRIHRSKITYSSCFASFEWTNSTVVLVCRIPSSSVAPKSCGLFCNPLHCSHILIDVPSMLCLSPFCLSSILFGFPRLWQESARKYRSTVYPNSSEKSHQFYCKVMKYCPVKQTNKFGSHCVIFWSTSNLCKVSAFSWLLETAFGFCWNFIFFCILSFIALMGASRDAAIVLCLRFCGVAMAQY